MARNQVQFQKGLGMAEFMARYGTEELCHDALVKMRWPDSQNLKIVAQSKLPLASFKNAGKRTFGIRVFGVDRAHVHLPLSRRHKIRQAL